MTPTRTGLHRAAVALHSVVHSPLGTTVTGGVICWLGGAELVRRLAESREVVGGEAGVLAVGLLAVIMGVCDLVLGVRVTAEGVYLSEQSHPRRRWAVSLGRWANAPKTELLVGGMVLLGCTIDIGLGLAEHDEAGVPLWVLGLLLVGLTRVIGNLAELNIGMNLVEEADGDRGAGHLMLLLQRRLRRPWVMLLGGAAALVLGLLEQVAHLGGDPATPDRVSRYGILLVGATEVLAAVPLLFGSAELLDTGLEELEEDTTHGSTA